MRVDWLKIHAFKNLTDVVINFDEGELSTVLVGENGTGKSNVIEALVTIFRDLDLNEPTEFSYSIAYSCHGHDIVIDSSFTEPGEFSASVDSVAYNKRKFFEGRNEFLPNNVFGYYSGSSRRLEVLFDKHQVKYYRRVIDPGSKPDDIQDIELRRLFYCRPSYGQLALLSYFAFGSDSAKAFLKKHMGISAFDSALLVLRKPRWAGTKPTKHQLTYGDARFWYSAGIVRGLLDALWSHSLAPINDRNREQDDYRTKPFSERQVYIFIDCATTLQKLAKSFGDEKTFFLLLETLDISDLIREVRIWVDKDDVEGEIPFHEVSDGEKQLLSVLGLMRFAGRDESLFLLDEPDTHLNPAWKWDYLQLVKEVAQNSGESHIILTSHDPLTMGGLKASQVQVMSREDGGKIVASPPGVDPRGLGFTNILTQIFGLQTTLDPDTQKSLDERNVLLRLDSRSASQEKRLVHISEELKKLGFLLEDREPEYALFLRALDELKKEKRVPLSPAEIVSRNEVGERLLREIVSKRKTQ